MQAIAYCFSIVAAKGNYSKLNSTLFAVFLYYMQ